MPTGRDDVRPRGLEETLRRIHPNSANLFHRRSPFNEICNDLILAHAMPSGAVHPNTPFNNRSAGKLSMLRRQSQLRSLKCAMAMITGGSLAQCFTSRVY